MVLLHEEQGQVFRKFKEFKALIENQTDKKTKIFRSDNDREFTLGNFKKLFSDS